MDADGTLTIDKADGLEQDAEASRSNRRCALRRASLWSG